MKIRMDFVTNSSSSGFVVICVKKKDGETIEARREWEAGYGELLGADYGESEYGYFEDNHASEMFRDEFFLVADGKELLSVFQKNAEELKYYDGYPSFCEKLEMIHSTKEIESIHLEGQTGYDTGGYSGMKLDYSFDDEIPYVTSENYTTDYKNGCYLYGNFQDVDRFQKEMKKNGWKCLRNLNDMPRNTILKFKPSHMNDSWWHPFGDSSWGENRQVRFMVIADETATSMDMMTIRYFRALQKKTNLEFIKASDFEKIGKFIIPANRNKIKTLKDTAVWIELSDGTSAWHAAWKKGGYPRIDDYHETCSYTVADSATTRFGPNTKGVYTEADFMQAISKLPDVDRVEPIAFKGKRFCLAGKKKDTDPIKEAVIRYGGEIVPGALSEHNADVFVFTEPNKNYGKAVRLHVRGYKISIIYAPDFWESIKKYPPKVVVEDVDAAIAGPTEGPLKGCVCAIAGRFQFGKKTDVEKYITDHAGKYSATLNKEVNMLIVGKMPEYASSRLERNALERYEKAEELLRQGQQITILEEKEFFQKYKASEQNTEQGEVSLNGKVCCLTGDFDFGTKGEVSAYITEMGGICTGSVSQKTDVLIIGAQGSANYSHGSYGSKYMKAKELQEKGKDIEILHEKDFFEKYKK